MCRTVLHVGRELPVTIALKNIIQKSCPEEYEERRREETLEAAAGAAPGVVSLPLFVMQVSKRDLLWNCIVWI